MAIFLDPILGNDPRLGFWHLLAVPTTVDCGDGRMLHVTAWKPEVPISPHHHVYVTVTGRLCLPRESTEEALQELSMQTPPQPQDTTDINITTMDTPEGFRAYLRRDGTPYLKEVEG